MNPVPLFLIIVSLPLLLGGCGEKHEGVNERELEKREGMAYLKGAPYTGKTYSLDYAQKRKLRETNYKDGKKDGLEVRLNRNGKKSTETNYKDGKQDGLDVVWRSNEKKWSERNFKNGKKDGLEVMWYRNGQKQYEANYKDGKQNGLYVEWFENGQKEAEANFKDDKLDDGLQLMWHENGQKKSEENYKHGKLISKKYWNSKGEPVDSFEEADKK